MCYMIYMPAPKRISKLSFILVPDDGSKNNAQSIKAAQRACRVAHLLGFLPFSPLLHYMTYLSSGELAMEMRELAWQWLRRSDRIWLQFPSEESDRLDAIAYDILNENRKLGPRYNNCEGRRPVYQLHASGCEIGLVPVAMHATEIRELLHMNLTVNFSRSCM